MEVENALLVEENRFSKGHAILTVFGLLVPVPS